MNRSLQVNIK